MLLSERSNTKQRGGGVSARRPRPPAAAQGEVLVTGVISKLRSCFPELTRPSRGRTQPSSPWSPIKGWINAADSS